MSFVRLMSDLFGKKNTSRRGAPDRRRTLRLESLEQRALLTAVAVEAASFAQLKEYAESGGDYDITLTADITVGAGETINIGGAGAGNISIDGGPGGHCVTSSAGSRTASLFNVSAGDSLTLNNLTISGLSYSSGNGAVFSQDGGSIAVNSGTTIASCTAVNGGVAYVSGGTFTVGSDAADDAEVNFTGNYAQIGGVIYLDTGGKLEIHGGTFSDNSVPSPEGGSGTDVDRGVGDGGVIFAETRDPITITGGSFKNNLADRGGVIYAKSGDSIDISGGSFKENIANRGGAIYAKSGDSINISGSTTEFLDNWAKKHGGVIYTYETDTLNVSGGTFAGNYANGNGGAFYADTGISVVISDGTFSNNSSGRSGQGGSGGVIFVWEANNSITISGGTFEKNYALGQGGGVVHLRVGGELKIENGTFKENYALKCGGVVYVYNSATAVTVSGGTFTENYAPKGGALYVWGAIAHITGGTFSGNYATDTGPVSDPGLGGAIYTSNDRNYDAQVNINGAVFENNSALYGGAIYATVRSGATTSVTVNLATVTMNNNTATGNGGAIANNGAVVTDTDATYGDTTAVKTFTGNSAVNGGAVFSSGTFTLSNAVFTENYSVGNGGAVDNLAAGTVTLTGAKFSGNSALGSAAPVNQIDWTGSDLGTGDGGAIQNWGTAALIDAYFVGNSAHDGGAIANGARATMTLSQTAASGDDAPLGFSGNGAVNGGAIINVGTLTRAADQTAEIVFARNSSYSNGGAISNSDNGGAAADGSLGLYKAAFTENTAGTAEQTGSGGAILSKKALTITDSTFSGNSANKGGKGGAIDHTGGTMVLTTNDFTGNSASATGFGGAVNTWAGASIDDCRFTENSAKYGGAVSVLGNDQTAVITDALFEQNSAVSYGGAVYASGTVEIDGAMIKDNTASLGGGVLAITSNISDTSTPQLGRGKVIFTGQTTIFEGNTATKAAKGQSVGSDICASSSNSAAGNGGVIEIATMPQFSTGTGYKLAIDRSILVLPGGMDVDGLSEIVNVYYSKDTVCGYTYSENTLTFTSLNSGSGTNKWRIYWDGGASGSYTEYDGTGALPSGTVAGAATVLIKGFGVTAKGADYEINYYLIPSLSAGTGAASEALFDDALLDDAEMFEGLAPQSSALEEYCEECYL